MELNINGEEIVLECLKRGVIINCTMERVLRFLPPLDVSQVDIDALMDTLADVFDGVKV